MSNRRPRRSEVALKGEKAIMSDKVFTKKMTLSICLILLCLCALSISAGAFFTDSKNSQAKTFSTATFDLTITSKHSVLDDPNDPLNTNRKDETINL